MFAGIVFAQEDASADRTVIAFSDPMKPGLIEARVLNGKITVQGYEGKEVIVEAQSSGKVLRHGPSIPHRIGSVHADYLPSLLQG